MPKNIDIDYEHQKCAYCNGALIKHETNSVLVRLKEFKQGAVGHIADAVTYFTNAQALHDIASDFDMDKMRVPRCKKCAAKHDKLGMFDRSARVEAKNKTIEYVIENSSDGWTIDYFKIGKKVFGGPTISSVVSAKKTYSNLTKNTADKKNKRQPSELDLKLMKELVNLETIINNGQGYHGVFEEDVRENYENFCIQHPTGNSIAYIILGQIYSHGINTRVNVIKAKDFFQKAINLNNELAYKYLAQIMLTEHNLDDAIILLTIGMKKGDQEAGNILKNISKNI